MLQMHQPEMQSKSRGRRSSCCCRQIKQDHFDAQMREKKLNFISTIAFLKCTIPTVAGLIYCLFSVFFNQFKLYNITMNLSVR